MIERYNLKMNKYAKKVGLFCNARDEKNIREWAAYHLLIGFDYIVIFDHKSREPLIDIFKNFDKRVKVIKTELEENIKLKLMNSAKLIAKQINLDWFIYLDADEFLILNPFFKGVKHFLNSFSYADSVGINWLMFGSNNLVKEPCGLLLENYTKSSKLLDHHVKSFVRPSKIVNCINPHYYEMKDPTKMFGINFKTMRPPYYFNENDKPYYQVPAYIAHYVFQSEETYKRRKIDIKGDDGTTRTDIGKNIHKHYNDIVNLQPKRYIQQIKQFLNFYSSDT
jgi:hypothetical protein